MATSDIVCPTCLRCPLVAHCVHGAIRCTRDVYASQVIPRILKAYVLCMLSYLCCNRHCLPNLSPVSIGCTLCAWSRTLYPDVYALQILQWSSSRSSPNLSSLATRFYDIVSAKPIACRLEDEGRPRRLPHIVFITLTLQLHCYEMTLFKEHLWSVWLLDVETIHMSNYL